MEEYREVRISELNNIYQRIQGVEVLLKKLKQDIMATIDRAEYMHKNKNKHIDAHLGVK